MTRRPRWLLRAGAAVLAVTLLAGGCSGEDEGPKGPGAPAASSPSPSPAGVPTQASLGRVFGKLPAKNRQAVVNTVARVVDGWVDAAYLGEFPRARFGPAFSSFTKGARADAGKQLALLTNQAISGRIESAVATQRRVVVDVLGAKGRPVGATARVVLQFKTSGEVARTETVRASLYLRREKGKWQVFGYDVIRNDRGAA